MTGYKYVLQYKMATCHHPGKPFLGKTILLQRYVMYQHLPLQRLNFGAGKSVPWPAGFFSLFSSFPKLTNSPQDQMIFHTNG